jgi:hypothetical protein
VAPVLWAGKQGRVSGGNNAGAQPACRPLVRAHPFIPHTNASFHQKTTLCMAPSPALGGGEREKVIGKLSFLTASYEHTLLGLWT